jgi:hypothetical protein
MTSDVLPIEEDFKTVLAQVGERESEKAKDGPTAGYTSRLKHHVEFLRRLFDSIRRMNAEEDWECLSKFLG